MYAQSVLRRIPVLAFTVATALLVITLDRTTSNTATGETSLASPLATPTAVFHSPLPTPTPKPALSDAARQALAYIAKREGIPGTSLDTVADHRTEYKALGRQFQVVTLVDRRPQGQVYKLLVDLRDGRIEEDISALMAAEGHAQQSQYGKLHPSLSNRLQALGDDDVLPVAVWITATPGQSLADQQKAVFAILAIKYPEAQAAMQHGRVPMDVNEPQLAKRIEAEYIALLSAQMETRTRPLVTELKQRGLAVITYSGMPSFAAILPKREILELARRSDVNTIYLIEREEQPALDSAVPTSLAPEVWARGYNGNGKIVAILEHGNVDTNNSFLHLSPVKRDADNGIQDHTTRVASDAASFHDTYKGMAFGATVLSAGENGQQSDVVSALQWAIDQGGHVINYSAGFEEDNLVNYLDRAFDYWVRLRSRAVVVAAGNSGASIISPGKAWNVITVGATHDNYSVTWSDDTMWVDSAYINPVSPASDREKPEVVAVGASVTAVGVNDVPLTRSGTSHAAPQVTGLAALLIDRNSHLQYYPEATKAIIMAAATHNIVGPTTIVQNQGDLRDRAGAINAVFADNVTQLRSDPNITCYTSCWWGNYIDNSVLPIGQDLERTFYSEKGDLIRIAITWFSNADSSYSLDSLDTDLDLRIKSPNNQYISGVGSLSFDNNYEMVEFVAPQAGIYKIAVRKVRASEPSNWLGIALLRLHQVYIPLVLKDS